MNTLRELLNNIWIVSPLKVVAMSIEHGLWDHIAEQGGEVRIIDVLAKYSWKERPFVRIVDIFIDLGLIVQYEQMLRLTPISRKWLVKTSRNYIGDFIMRANTLAKAFDEHLETLMAEDVPDKTMCTQTRDAFGNDISAAEVFARSMDAMTREFANEILSRIEITDIQRCLDIGAGLGAMTNIISEKRPSAEITVLELPGVAQLLQDQVNTFTYSKQFKVISADWRDLKDHIEPNEKFDLIILSQILHEEKREDAKILIEICADLLSPNGQLAIVGFLDDTSFLTHLFTLNLLMELGSDNITQHEISSVAEHNGVLLQTTYISPTSGRMLWLGQKSIRHNFLSATI
jgi:tRNA A58 N-methylase Trm61